MSSTDVPTRMQYQTAASGFIAPVIVVMTAVVALGEPHVGDSLRTGGATPIFFDGFEDAEQFLDLFPLDGSRWSFVQEEPRGNLVSLTTEQVHTGAQALKCYARAYNGVNASKADIGNSLLSFANGDEVWTEAWIYLVGGTPTPNVFLWDLEAPDTCTSVIACPREGTGRLCNSPGRRLYLTGPAGGWLKSDLGKWCRGRNFEQLAGQEVSLPTDTWVRIRTYQRLSDQWDGRMKVWQDDLLVIDAVGITLPREDARYTRLEVGITANGDETNSHILYLDDVRVWNRRPDWYRVTKRRWRYRNDAHRD